MADTDPRPGPGRPTKLLDDAVEEAVLDAIRYGATIEAACAAAGITDRTYYAWMARGREAKDTLEETGELPNTGRPFLEACARAHAQGQAANVALLWKITEGGYVTKTRTRRMRDPGTGDLVEETETDLAPPDLRAFTWYLERRHPETFKKAVELEISGPGGGRCRWPATRWAGLRS
jgi:transposase-like protein